MQFEKGYLYHIYNQGNNKQKIFFNRENYIFFLRKIRLYILPYADILAWCLMPNHFHLMVLVNFEELEIDMMTGKDDTMILSDRIISKNPKTRTFNDSIAILLRSYTRAINKEQNRTGSLFKAHTKAECISCPNGITPSFMFDTMTLSHRINIIAPEKQYPQTCFNYIHNNPVKANLVKFAEAWEYSSALDYFGSRKGTLVNKKGAKEYGLI